MNATEFFSEYRALFDASNPKNLLEKARKKWNSRNAFTRMILPQIGKILAQGGCAAQYEYYKIDVIGWTDQKKRLKELARPADYKVNKHFWSLEVAVEHENDRFDWTDELVKLLYVNCPLRVVIGYYPEHLTEAALEQTVAYASGVVAMANEKGDLVREDQDYLLILGKNHSDPQELGCDTYRAYVYQKDGFVRIDG